MDSSSPTRHDRAAVPPPKPNWKIWAPVLGAIAVAVITGFSGIGEKLLDRSTSSSTSGTPTPVSPSGATQQNLMLFNGVVSYPTKNLIDNGQLSVAVNPPTTAGTQVNIAVGTPNHHIEEWKDVSQGIRR